MAKKPNPAQTAKVVAHIRGNWPAMAAEWYGPEMIAPPEDDGVDWYALSNGLSGVFPDGTRFNED